VLSFGLLIFRQVAPIELIQAEIAKTVENLFMLLFKREIPTNVEFWSVFMKNEPLRSFRRR
jgi:hypothetical protein